MVTMRVQAKGSGRIVDWSEMLRGRLKDTSRLASLFFSTTLTDVITDLCELAESIDSSYRIVIVVPNGPTSASLDLSLLGVGFEIVCSRRLVRGLFPFNPFAAEFGSNYDVVVTVNGTSDEVRSKVGTLLQGKYPCKLIA